MASYARSPCRIPLLNGPASTTTTVPPTTTTLPTTAPSTTEAVEGPADTTVSES